MKDLAFALLALACVAMNSAAAGDGRIARRDLAALGLGQLEEISDADGLRVRGRSGSSSRTSARVSGSGTVRGSQSGSEPSGSVSIRSENTSHKRGAQQTSTTQATVFDGGSGGGAAKTVGNIQQTNAAQFDGQVVTIISGAEILYGVYSISGSTSFAVGMGTGIP